MRGIYALGVCTRNNIADLRGANGRIFRGIVAYLWSIKRRFGGDLWKFLGWHNDPLPKLP